MDVLNEPVFKSINHLDMVKGKWFNWHKESIYRESEEPPYMFTMTFERTRKEPSMVTCLYRPDESVVYIGGVSYQALDGVMAEAICLLAVLGEKGTIMPLYYRNDNYRGIYNTLMKSTRRKKQ